MLLFTGYLVREHFTATYTATYVIKTIGTIIPPSMRSLTFEVPFLRVPMTHSIFRKTSKPLMPQFPTKYHKFCFYATHARPGFSKLSVF